MNRSTSNRVATALATMAVTALLLVATGAPGEAAVPPSLHVLKAPAGSCLVPRVASSTFPAFWLLDEPYSHATQTWLLKDGRLDTFMTRVPCTTSHALEVFAVKQLWTSAAQIPVDGTAAAVRLWRDRIVPFCTAKARAYLGLPRSAKPVFAAVWPNRAQARALGSLGVRCLLLNQTQSTGTTIGLGSMGNKSWKASGARYFNSTPTAPVVQSSSVSCTATVDAVTIIRRLRLSTDLRWIIPTSPRFGGSSFIAPSSLVAPTGVAGSYAFPAQAPTATSIEVDQAWNVPVGTAEVTLPTSVVTRWVSPVGARISYRLTLPASALSTAGCSS